ncbi:helix-turn-helix transcriptional regulator [Gordonia sp. ABSL11-1]|uniref:helix-turn-helix domain-containing protein n=1 Tax=Gordonia sp. ABSL11-1 TaxID=3053924 RepID=UPI0025731C27|nr:helix-turn-helix transcriptional regulator [Gordonia sp. ABSL11-1]MDL9944269.1 helix-turn-helix transcriptional regulator [Gordonia sp. ABSL11-1]
MDDTTPLALAMGAAIRATREAQSLSAVKLSALTEEVGHRIHRVAIGKMEEGEREPTVTELIVLARALRVPPLELIYPNLPDGFAEAWPGHVERAFTAAQWFSGELALVDEPDGSASFDQHEVADTTRVGSARKIQEALAEWSIAGFRVDALAAKHSEGLEVDTAIRLANLAQKNLVDVVVRAVRRGETIEPYLYPEQIQEPIREASRAVSKASVERARRVAEEIRGSLLKGDDDAAR